MTAHQDFNAPIADCPADSASRPVWVASALTLQLDLYRQLDVLSRRQGVLIDDDDTDRLLTVLGERQHVVDRIAEIGALLEPIRRHWDPFLQSLPGPTREQLRALVDTLAELAGLVAGRDEADRRRLELRRLAVGQELASVARGRSAVQAYGGRTTAIPLFQDREA